MLSHEQVGQNREEYLSLIDSITREFDKEKFIDWLDNKSDFFVAPASTKYHCSYEGGLCEHSLNVYHMLKRLIDDAKAVKPDFPDYDEDTIIIVALLHDLSKANFYEKYWRNVKNQETGKWEQVMDYKVREDRFIYGSHEQTAEFMASAFFPLTIEERVCILNHMGGKSFDSTQADLSVIYGKYPLACLLYTADLLSTFCAESR